MKPEQVKDWKSKWGSLFLDGLKMKYDKPKGQRLKRYFRCINATNGLWWVPELNEWSEFSTGMDMQNFCPCKTVRAFRRHLRKHPEIRGCAELVSVYDGYDIKG